MITNILEKIFTFRGLCGTFDGNKANDFHDIGGSTPEPGQAPRHAEQWRIQPGHSSLFDGPPPALGRGGGGGTGRLCLCEQQTEIVTVGGATWARDSPDPRDPGATCHPWWQLRAPARARHYVDITPAVRGGDEYVNDQAAAGPGSQQEAASTGSKPRAEGVGVHWSLHQQRHARSPGYSRGRDSNPGPLAAGPPSYPTPAGLTAAGVAALCSNTVLNSSVATQCGPYIQEDLSIALDICVLGRSLLYQSFICIYLHFI